MLWARYERWVLEPEFESVWLLWPWLMASMLYVLVTLFRKENA